MAANTGEQRSIEPVEKPSFEAGNKILETTPKVWRNFEKIIRMASQAVLVIGMLGLGGLILSTVIDVVGSKTPLNWPLPGFINILGLSQLAAMSFSMSATFLAGQHIKVELIVNRFPKAYQGLVGTLVSLLSLILFAMIIWRLIVLGQSFQKSGEQVDVIYIPIYPFIYGMVLGFVPLFLALIYQLGNSVSRMVRR